ncbi:hypothetical protein F5X98DRAFT_381516 [Xylaria grammica]|nr:hypothetical protein F5X98DRAFT_381516 [Xylaria grammica]
MPSDLVRKALRRKYNPRDNTIQKWRQDLSRARRTVIHLEDFIVTRDKLDGLLELVEACETEMIKGSHDGLVDHGAIRVELKTGGSYKDNTAWQPCSVDIDTPCTSNLVKTTLYFDKIKLIVEASHNPEKGAEPGKQKLITEYLDMKSVSKEMIQRLENIVPAIPGFAFRIIHILYSEDSSKPDCRPEAKQRVENYLESYFGSSLSAEIMTNFSSADDIHVSLKRLRRNKLESSGVKESEFEDYIAPPAIHTGFVVIMALLHLQKTDQRFWGLAAQMMMERYPSGSPMETGLKNSSVKSEEDYIGSCITVATWKNIFEDLCKIPELTQQLNAPPTIPDLTENERLIWNEGKFQPTHERLWCHPANQILKEIFPDSHHDVLPFLPLYELFPDATFVNQKVDSEVHDTNNGRNAIFESKFHGVLPSGDAVKETQSLTLSSLGQICHYCMLSATAIGVVITTVELIFIQITTEMNIDEVAQAMSEDMSETASEANPQTPPMIRKRPEERLPSVEQYCI